MHADPPSPHIVRSFGSLIAAESETGITISTGSELGRGDVRSGKVLIANTGSSAGSFRLFESDASNDFPAGELTLAIEDVTAEDFPTRYVGEIGNLPPGGIDLGSFPPQQSRRFRFLVILDLNSRSGGQGRSAGATYEWSLVTAGSLRD